ncbi:MAG: ribonuclease HIII [Verrucomicrobia bacterium]|nr:ribonuclease HIII [Verrucomicrobiota bacterium]
MLSKVQTYTAALTLSQAETLRAILEEQGFEFAERPYTLFFAHKAKLSVAAYEKGPKVVVQGKDTEDFVRFTLEPQVLGEAKLGYEELLHPEMFQPHFGIDESGKGDFFGPLVVAGVYVDAGIARSFQKAGVMDSKRIGSDRRIKELARLIVQTPGATHNIVMIGPARYNELYEKFANLNDLLGWGHARVIENLLSARPECPRALSDRFANERVIRNALLERGTTIQVDQRTKAEADVAVAAASIVARERFVTWLEDRGKVLGIALPKGVSDQVKEAARALVARGGPEALKQFAKIHFRTAAEVLGG